MLLEATVGTLRYNGFTFPPAIRARINSRTVLDSTGRYTKHAVHTLQVETVLYPGVETDLFPDTLLSADGVADTVEVQNSYFGMDKLKQLLLENGRPFKFVGKGFGHHFEIESGDLEFGPKVLSLDWEPIGASKAVRIVWTVEVAVSNCPTQKGASLAGQVQEFSYDSDYSLDERGLTVRTITGQVVIANRLLLGSNETTVDRLRDRFSVEVPLGFQRLRQHYSISADQRTMRFVVVDRQHESNIAPHEGIIEHDVDHRVSSVGQFVATQFLVTVSGTFTVAPNYSKSFAWLAFLYFVKSRRDAALSHAVATDNNGVAQENVAIPTKLQIDDKLTARTISFSISWMVFSDPDRFLDGTGVLAKVEGSNWSSYRNSMTQSWGVRGHAKLTQLPSRVFTNCDDTPVSTGEGGGFYIADFADDPLRQDNGRLFLIENCTPVWVYFDHECSLRTDSKQAPLHETGGSSEYQRSQGPDYQESGGSGGTYRASIMHVQGQPRFTVTFRGSAQRIGEKILKPKLLSYGTITDIQPIGEGTFVNRPTKQVMGCELHTVYWSQEYEIRGVPVNDDYITNPNIRIPKP